MGFKRSTSCWMIMAAMAICAKADGDTPISNLRLTTSANGGGNSFSNLVVSGDGNGLTNLASNVVAAAIGATGGSTYYDRSGNWTTPAGGSVQTNLDVTTGGTYTANATGWSGFDITMTNNLTLNAPTNASWDGKKLQFRCYASGGNRSLVLSPIGIKIPLSSSMNYTNTITNGTTSILLIDYNARNTNWFVEAYIYGY